MWTTEEHRRFNIDLDRIEDNVSDRDRNYNFINSKENAHMFKSTGVRWMLDRMDTSKQGSKILREDGKWDEARVKTYLSAVEKFRQLLLFCVHVSSGQPARGPEITSMRFKNGMLQDRNIFIIGGQFTTVTRYHKS